MINQCYPTLADNTICKLGVDLYSPLVPTLNSYSELTLSLLLDRKVPTFFKNRYPGLISSKTYDYDTLYSVLTNVGFSWGLLELKKDETRGGYSSAGGRLIKDLLLYSCGKITKEELESEMADVMYKKYNEYLNSCPRR